MKMYLHFLLVLNTLLVQVLKINLMLGKDLFVVYSIMTADDLVTTGMIMTQFSWNIPASASDLILSDLILSYLVLSYQKY